MDERGSVTVEYTVILVTLSLGVALALAALGPVLAQSFLARVTWLLLPLP